MTRSSLAVTLVHFLFFIHSSIELALVFDRTDLLPSNQVEVELLTGSTDGKGLSLELGVTPFHIT